MAPGPKARIIALLLYLSWVGTAIADPSSTLSPSQALQALDKRQSSCPTSNPVSCQATDPKLPGNFCCPTGTACISTDSSSSALCCPSNGDCLAIQTISCDVGLQDASRANGGPVFTQNTNGNLPTCGNACCPNGYTCGQDTSGNSICQLNTRTAITAAQRANPAPSSSSTTPSSTTSNSASPTSSDTNPSRTSNPNIQSSGVNGTNSTAGSTSKNSSFPPGVFIAGFVPGIVVGALAVLAFFILTGRLKKQQGGAGGAGKTSSIYASRPEITDPYGNLSRDPGNNMAAGAPVGGAAGGGAGAFSRSTKSLFKKKSPIGTPGLPFDKAETNWRNLTPPEDGNIPDAGYSIAAGPGARAPNGPRGDMPSNPFESDADEGSAINRQGSNTSASSGVNGRRASPGYSLPSNPRPVNNPNRTDSVGEIIQIYTPPERDLPRPGGAVAPLRGMNSQRRSRDAGFGYDLEKPRAAPPVPQMQRNMDDDEKSVYPASVYDEYRGETLTPAKYDGGQGYSNRPRNAETGSRDRPETTFTEMLRAINFPDPKGVPANAPAMPSIPKEYR